MYTGVKVNYKDDIEETINIIQCRKKKQAEKKTLFVQKIIGLAVILIGAASAVALEGDITVLCFCLMLGLALICTRKTWIQ